MKQKVVVGLSGGVDSSVAVAFLIDQGYDVTGVYITCWSGPGCRSEEDRKDALNIALQLGIPFVHLDFQTAYKEKVYEYMMSEYQSGRTPNPDVLCNKEIKFGLFYDWAMKEGYDFVATGHYAQTDGKQLLRSVDEHKDQTYFLYQLRQDQLAHILFPIGHMTKPEVRKEAERRKLLSATKPDSQGICFIGDVNVSKFLEERIEKKAGKILLKGTVVGEHRGVWFYTIGQRIAITHSKTLADLGYDPTNLPQFYVMTKDVQNNVLEVGIDEMLFADTVILDDCHWIGDISESTDLLMRIRHGGELVHVKSFEVKDEEVYLTLQKSVRAVASGQMAVLYHGNVCLGGGVIK